MSAVVADQEATGLEPGRAATIRDLNDQLRRTGRGGRILVTAGVAALPEAERAAIIAAVRAFDAFDADNDPHGEHDCAVLTVGAERVIWKIDAYDRELRFASPDPADAAVPRRVLTIILAEKY